MARITEDVRLPSNGVPYEIDKVTLANMTTAEEKMIYSSSSDNAIDRIIQKCIHSEVDLDDLLLDDKRFLMIRLRMLTYGNKYPIQLGCAICDNKFEHVIDFNDVDVIELDKDFEIPEITLPLNGDKIKLKFLTGHTFNELDRSISKRVEKFSDQDEGEVAYIYSLAYLIDTINDEVVPAEQLFSYIDNLHVRDSGSLKRASNELSFGYPPVLATLCPKCRKEVAFRLPNTVDFFLAEYVD